MSDERQPHSMESGMGSQGAVRVFIPCPVCRAPISLDNLSEELPEQLVCPHCSSVLER